MSFHHRISTIYRKELTDILRDRRTLIAMILVPIVLYPLLMLGSIQALSYQVEALEDEQIVVGVLGPAQQEFLRLLIERDALTLAALAAERPLDTAEDDEQDHPRPLDNVKTVAFTSREYLAAAVQERSIHLGVVFDRERIPRSLGQQVPVEFLCDREDVRGFNAMLLIQEMLDRTKNRLAERRLAQRGLPLEMLEPFVIRVTDLATPTSILGHILPLILILMTITGAIYPAIDLTAGERERGTLESLMVCPVAVIDVIVGKFLVVTTVAIMGAALNLASVSATVYFGGYDVVVAQGGGGVPFGKMALILLCLIPFAVLMSAIMIAVCSYARTFKEAQNYVTPVILAVLIPGGIAALPATQLEGVMLVMPVGNMVLLARDFLLGTTVPLGAIAIVLLSTSLYAGAAVAAAANIFGKESVVFADAASIKRTFARSLIKPSARPTISMALLLVSILFPIWFFVQSALSPGPDEGAGRLLYASGLLMPVLFVGVPAAVLLYVKVNIRNSLYLRVPSPRYWIAGLLVGSSAWVLAHELNVFQQRLIGVPQAVVESAQKLAETLTTLPLVNVIIVIAVIPAVCEELLFRGVLLSGLGSAARKWTAIIVSAVVFSVFHFFLFKFPVTAALGVVLAFLCWHSRSILPGVIAHGLHNGLGVLTVVRPGWMETIGVIQSEDATWVHLPAHILIIGGLVFIGGLLMAGRAAQTQSVRSAPAIAERGPSSW